MNSIQDEITAMQDGLLNGTAPVNSSRITAPSASFTNSTISSLTVGTLTVSSNVTVNGWIVGRSEYDAGNSSAAITLDFATNGPFQKVTRTTTCTVTLVSPPSPGFVTVKFVKSASTATMGVSFTPTVKWAGGSAPSWSTAANAIDLATLYYDGSSVWYGSQQAGFA